MLSNKDRALLKVHEAIQAEGYSPEDTVVLMHCDSPHCGDRLTEHSDGLPSECGACGWDYDMDAGENVEKYIARLESADNAARKREEDFRDELDDLDDEVQSVKADVRWWKTRYNGVSTQNEHLSSLLETNRQEVARLRGDVSIPPTPEKEGES